MAARYVRSGATGANNGTTKADAFTTLAAAFTAGSAGDDYFVASDHAESNAAGALNLTPKGTVLAPDHIYCVDFAGSTPPVTADLRDTATITQAAAAALNIARASQSWSYWHGIKFIHSGASGAFDIGTGDGACWFNECKTSVTNSANNQWQRWLGAYIEWRKPTFQFNSVFCALIPDGATTVVDGMGTQIVVGTVFPDWLFSGPSLDKTTSVTVKNVDFSNLPSGKAIKDMRNNGYLYHFENCKLNATPWSYAGGTTATNRAMAVLGCGASNRDDALYSYFGSLVTERTVKRTAGAQDPAGNGFSWKIVPGYGAVNTCNRDNCFIGPEMDLWNDVVGTPITLTIHLLADNNITWTDIEAWLRVSYPGVSGSPLGSVVTSEPARLTTASNLASDSAEAWTTTGTTNAVKLKISVTLTAQRAGPLRWQLFIGRSSGTLYACPKIDVS